MIVVLLVFVVVAAYIAIESAAIKHNHINEPLIWVEHGPEQHQEEIERHDILKSLLLFGEPGLGKTLFARCTAKKLEEVYGHNVDFNIKVAGQLKSSYDVEEFVKSITPYSVVFIDEIHSLRLSIEELLYSVLQDNIYYPVHDTLSVDDYTLRIGDKRSGVIEIPPCTWIAATTDAGTISRPLRDRFRLSIELERMDKKNSELIAKSFDRVNRSVSFDDYYGQDKAKKIIGMHIESIGHTPEKMTDEAANKIASVSFGVPRVINSYRMHGAARAGQLRKPVIDEGDVNYAMAVIGVDDNGMMDVDRRVIKYLGDVGAIATANKPKRVSKRELAFAAGCSVNDIDNMVVPRMMGAGLLAKSSSLTNVLTRKCLNLY